MAGVCIATTCIDLKALTEIPLTPAQNRLSMMNRADSGGLHPVATGATQIQTLQVPGGDIRTRRSSLQGPPGAHRNQLDAQVRTGGDGENDFHHVILMENHHFQSSIFLHLLS